MSEFTFTVDDVMAQVRALAAERPDYVYRPVAPGALCSYVTGQDGQGCIVGQALMRLGVPKERLAASEADEGTAVPADELLQDLLDLDTAAMATNEVGWIMSVQTGQDSGETWGKAVAYATVHELEGY